MTHRLALTLSASSFALLSIALLAGCAAASTTSSSAPGGAGGSSAASTPAASAPVGSADGACKYLSIADLNSILGRSYISSSNVPVSDPIDYNYCAYKTAGKAEFDLLVSTTDPSGVMSVENEAAGNRLAPLAGVGDSAINDSSELVVAYGQDVIGAGDDVTDSGMHAVTLDQLKAIVAKAHGAMG